MQYLITTNNNEPFLTIWFTYENHWVESVEMKVYDLINCVYTCDGEIWLQIGIDNL